MTDTVKIYTDIDSLLDLRQGILYSLSDNHKELADYLLSDEYNYRTTDTFTIVNSGLYEESYKKRNIDILPTSTITYILSCIKSKLANLEKRNTFYNEKKIPEVVVNIYPFVFTEKQKDQFQNLLFVKLETNTMVSIISMPPKDVSLMFLSSNEFITAFIYDFTTWMENHSKTIELVKTKDLLIYFPSLGKDIPDEVELKKITNLGFKDIFSYTEFLLSSSLNVSFLPVVFYSNTMTAIAHLSKFDTIFKNKKLETDEEIDISKFNIPEGI